MLRKVAILVISAGLTMSPLAVQAMGFGGIKLNSSLNEKLNADVSLLSASENDVQSLTIRLATEEAFLRSGIDRTALLNKLKFTVKQRSNGDYYIHVTTTESVREPFMNFLLEMNWKNGRMLREYTMLIDPPGRAPVQHAEPAPVIAETQISEPEPEVEDVAPEIMVPAEDPIIDVVEDEASPFVEPEPTVEVEAAEVPEPVIGMESVIPEPIVEEMFADEADIPVEAEPEVMVEPVVEVEPEVIVEPEMVEPELIADVPAAVEDVEVAEIPATEVFEEAPSNAVWPSIPLSAFDTTGDFEAPVATEMVTQVDEPVSEGELGDLDYGIIKKNDNLWNIAEKLRQGDESVSVYQVMMALLQSNPEAFTNNNVHRLKVGHVLRIEDASVLTNLSRKEAASAFVEQTAAWNNFRQEATDETAVQPIMAGESTTEDTLASEDAAGELTLSSPDGENLTAGGGANEETLNNDLATIQDQLRQAKSDSGTMRTRNVELNNKLQSLEDELNRLQRSLSVKDDELAALQHQLSGLNDKPVESPVIEKPTEVEQAVIEEAIVETPVITEEPVVTEEAPQPELLVEPVVEQVKPETSPIEVAEETTEPSIMDTVMGVVASVTAVFAGINLGGDSALFIGAPILIVLLIIVFIVIKRRRQGDNFQESILTGTASASDDPNASLSGDSTTFSEESSFLSDFAMSGASAIEADDSEVDPLTEADVFMAYGRYEAAEERLNEAVQSEPDRMELRAKLLELYHATQNKEAFESAAEDFYASLAGKEADSPLWAKVVEMGKEVAPENPLFSQGEAGGADILATSEVPAIDDPGMAMTDSQVMDIGLETGVFEAADLTGSTDAPADDLDFNLDLGEMAGGSTAAGEPAADLDFNLDMGTELESPVEAAAPDDGGLDFNLDMGTEEVASDPLGDFDLDMDMDTTEDAGLDFNLDMGTTEDDSSDLSLNFDSSDDDASLDLNLDASDTADSDIGGGDEVGTKLDLAKAYIDMGDPEGARSILDEVMDEGSSTQKEEAQSLLGQIA